MPLMISNGGRIFLNGGNLDITGTILSVGLLKKINFEVPVLKPEHWFFGKKTLALLVDSLSVIVGTCGGRGESTPASHAHPPQWVNK